MAAIVTVETTKQRQLNLLRGLVEKAQWRHDIKLPLSEVAPALDFHAPNFSDKNSPQSRPGSELCYDFNTLLEEGLIEIGYLRYEQDSYGGVIYRDPAIMVTSNGLAAVRQLENQPPPDYWKKAEVWFRSKWWSVPVVLLGVGVGWCLGIIGGIKAILEWFGVVK